MEGLMKVCSGDTVKEYLKKRGLIVRKARRMAQDRSE